MSGTPDPGGPVATEESRGPRIVVGADCSSGARAALLFALEDAVRRDLPVEAVIAYRPPDLWLDFYAVGTFSLEDARAGALERLKAFVDEVLPEGPQPPPEVRLRASLGTPAEVLIRESVGAELLVVGSRGHGGLAGMLLGSVSSSCATHASCPVTVVHSPEAHRERLHLRRRRHPEDKSTPVG